MSAIHDERCREKTARGNIFRHKKGAQHAASMKRRETGLDIRHFRCRSCGWYHIGKPSASRRLHEQV